VAVTAAAGVATLPLDLWRGLFRERRFGLSRQTLRGWLADRAKGEAVEIALAAAAWTAAVALGRALPRWWPVPAAAGLAVFVLVMSFVSPLVLEPLFNRFAPLADERLAAGLRALADRAGVPVRDVLVADASRRTTRTNAYVSGLGPTRRVVVWDTLLADVSEPELRLVIAHELGHRRARHVLKGTVLGMIGAVGFVFVLWAALGAPQPDDFPRAMLIFLGYGLAGAPALAWLSRRWEREADRASLELTGDRDAFVRAHLDLARKNLSDLTPPRLAYLFLFSHPTSPERIADARSR
ncbi:MAG TPA: M48 family metallopeptidase, partial [Gaiellaceae bacterium]|nr:M48 family metallopeptidase [Gaiellaceae bacterium]